MPPARPNEPELLVNGRPVIQQAQLEQLTFKEGSQVRLECQSSGGRPAPKIEWLNVSLQQQQQQHDNLLNLPDARELFKANSSASNRVSLLRSWWPHKKATYFVDSPESSTSLPVTSSSVTISLSRYDLQSQFVCLVVPQQHSSSSSSSSSNLEQSQFNSRSQLGQLVSGSVAKPGSGEPMVKGLRLNVQVKPSSVYFKVRDLEEETELELSQYLPGQNKIVPAPNYYQEDSQAGALSFYSLKLNRLYAIQCLVENSRPKSQISWFNKTLPLNVEQVHLNSSSHLADFLLPTSKNQNHRLTSFSKSVENSNGTFR